MERATHIYFEQSPNPNSLKFVLNFMIVPEGVSYDFPDISTTGNAPLARELFGFDYVRRVFFMNNFVTITKDPSREWPEIRDEIKQFLLAYFDEDKPVLDDDGQEEDHEHEDLSEMDLKIRTLLDEYVKPAVEQDGGAIEYHSFNDGVVKVLLQGSCSGCPSSMLTLKAGIENLLKSMIPEVKAVEAEGV